VAGNMDTQTEIHRRERGFHADRVGYERRRRLSALGYRGGVNTAGQALVDEIRRHPGDTALDLGCGTGWLSRTIGASFDRVVSLDIVTEVLGSDLLGVCGAAERLPFKDQTFEAVVGSGVLHHAADLNAAMSEIRRITKDGGLVAFAEPLAQHPVIRVYRKLSPQSRSADEHPFRLQQLEQAFGDFADVGLKPLDLATVIAAPLNVVPSLQRHVVPRITELLRRFDEILLARSRKLHSYAWCAVVTARVRHDAQEGSH
jgi:SAM-dependent methyltransferase